MAHQSTVLARSSGFGSVVTCPCGLVYVQLGCTTLTLSRSQYQRFVAMLLESAANSELLRDQAGEFEGGDAGPAHEEGNAAWPDLDSA